MNSKSTHTSSGGIGFFGMLGIVFITLKLLGYITWSWWWVLLPVYGPVVVVLVLVLIALAIAR